MASFEWAIEDVQTAHPGLYLEHFAAMAVALMARQTEPPCEFRVECEGFRPPDLGDESVFTLGVTWREDIAAKAERVWQAEQVNPVVERGAVAMTLLLFAHMIPGGQIRVTDHGQRADYWLPGLRCALEVSGTRRRREVPRRRREKIAQVLANPYGWAGYVVVCCFQPAHRTIHWCYHTPPETEHEAGE